MQGEIVHIRDTRDLLGLLDVWALVVVNFDIEVHLGEEKAADSKYVESPLFRRGIGII